MVRANYRDTHQNYWWLQWIATLLSMIGAYLNIEHLWFGFALWIVAAVLWIVWAAKMRPRSWAMIVTQCMFIGLNVYGIREWTKG